MSKNNAKDTSALGFIRDYLGFSMSAYIGAIITFVSSFINTRIFDKATLGKVNLFFTLLNCIVCVSYLGVDQSYCRYYNECNTEKDKQKLFNNCYMLSIYVAVVIGILCLICCKQLSHYIVGEVSFVIVFSLIVTSFAQITWRYLTLVQRMKQQIILYTILMVLNSITNKLSYTFTAFFSRDYTTCIIAIAFSSMLVTAFFWIIERKKIGRISPVIGYNKSTTKIMKFGLPLMPVTLLSWLNSSIPILLMKQMISYEAIGIYTNVVTLTTAINLVQSGFNSFWVPYYYSNYKNGNEQIKKIHNLVCMIMISCGLLLILFKNVLFLILGENYRAGNSFFSFLLISPICYTIGETTGIGINISEKSYLHSFSYISSIITNLLLCFILIQKFDEAGASMAVAISAIVGLGIKSFLGEKYYKSIENYGKSIGAVLILVLAAIWDYCIMDISFVLWTLGLVVLLWVLIIIYRKEIAYCKTIALVVLHKKR